MNRVFRRKAGKGKKKMAEIKIRHIEPGDAAAVADLIGDWQAANVVEFLGASSHTRCWVAEDASGAVVGAALGDIGISDDEIVVGKLVVRQDQRRQGYGTALLDRILKLAKRDGLKYVTGVADETDRESLEFWKAAGGEAVLAENLYDGKDGVVFKVPA